MTDFSSLTGLGFFALALMVCIVIWFMKEPGNPGNTGTGVREQ